MGVCGYCGRHRAVNDGGNSLVISILEAEWASIFSGPFYAVVGVIVRGTFGEEYPKHVIEANGRRIPVTHSDEYVAEDFRAFDASSIPTGVWDTIGA